MASFGIDVSEWQGNFNFNLAKSQGVNFAILRAAYHRRKDIMFEDNYKNAVAEGLEVGVYLYAMDRTPDEARETARWLAVNCLAGKKLSYPIYYDVEDSSIIELGSAALTDIVMAFCVTLEELGFWVGIYGGVFTFNHAVNDVELARFTHWVAAWRNVKPELDSENEVDLWQFGGETNVIRSVVIAYQVCDQDYSYRDFPLEIRASKLNGYGVYTLPKPHKDGIKKGSQVAVLKAVTYEGKQFTAYYPVYDVYEVKGNRVVIGVGQIITCAIHKKNLKLM